MYYFTKFGNHLLVSLCLFMCVRVMQGVFSGLLLCYAAFLIYSIYQQAYYPWELVCLCSFSKCILTLYLVNGMHYARRSKQKPRVARAGFKVASTSWNSQYAHKLGQTSGRAKHFSKGIRKVLTCTVSKGDSTIHEYTKSLFYPIYTVIFR